MSTAAAIQPRFVSVADAARACAVSEASVRKLIREGRLEVGRLGRRVLVPADALDRLIRGQGPDPDEDPHR